MPMGKKILVIEDDEAIANALGKRLSLAGYEVRLAPDAPQGAKAADDDAPDLIILDLTLPGGGGRSVLTHVKQSPLTKHIPVVVVTGLGRDEAARNVTLSDVQAYFQKPYDGAKLLAEIRRLLAATDPGASTKTILVVDYDTETLHALERQLTEHGYRVVTATDGEAALATVATIRPDLLVTSLILPKLDGRQLCEQLRLDERLHQLPCIIISDMAASTPEHTETAQATRKLAEAEFLRDGDPQALLSKIEELLARR